MCFEEGELGTVYQGPTKLQESMAHKNTDTAMDTTADQPAPLIQEDAPVPAPVVNVVPQQVTITNTGKKRITPMFLGSTQVQ